MKSVELPRIKAAFLYSDRFFPFNRICREITYLLKKRDWSVPGMHVEFLGFGDNLQFFSVKRIVGNSFKIEFGMEEGREKGKFKAYQKVVLPRHAIKAYDDESSMEYVTYVGKDWDADAEWFMAGNFDRSRLKGEPRRYLKYRGAWQKPCELALVYACMGMRPPLLIHADEQGDEYSPEPADSGKDPSIAWSLFVPDELLVREKRRLPNPWIKDGQQMNDAPPYLVTAQVISYFNSWLENKVVRGILGGGPEKTKQRFL